MRKLTPAAVRADFLAALKCTRDSFEEVEKSNVSTATKKLVAEQAFLAAAVLWEGFLSDVVVAFINRKPKTFVGHIESMVTITSKDALAKRALHILKPRAIREHLSVSEVRKILDDGDRNVTFEDINQMKEHAGKLLDAADAVGFLTLTTPDDAVVGAVTALRNFLAHRSLSSNETLQIALAHTSLHSELRRGPNKVHDVGAYLRATPALGAPQRLYRHLEEMAVLAAKVCS